jgi:hypothetical protein
MDIERIEMGGVTPGRLHDKTPQEGKMCSIKHMNGNAYRSGGRKEWNDPKVAFRCNQNGACQQTRLCNMALVIGFAEFSLLGIYCQALWAQLCQFSWRASAASVLASAHLIKSLNHDSKLHDVRLTALSLSIIARHLDPVGSVSLGSLLRHWLGEYHSTAPTLLNIWGIYRFQPNEVRLASA